jgi:hypothetical protein
VAGDPGWQITEMNAQARGDWTRYAKPDQEGADEPALGTYVPFRSNPGPLTVQTTAAMKNPVHPISADRMDVRIRKSSYVNGHFTSVEAASTRAQISLAGQTDPKQQIPGGGEQVSATLPVTAPSSGWDVYEVRLKPGQGNLQLPDWVGKWNTDSDATSADGNKTLGLRLIVESMLRSISEQQTFLVEYVAIGNR